MANLTKILIVPYFGDLPEWYDKFEYPKGYDHIFDTDLEGFKKRVRDKLGVEYIGQYGDGKLGDYRSLLGLLYEDEIKGYDYWGHCDFDVVWGDMDKFYPDSFIDKNYVISGHDSYVNGSFSLYKNMDEVNCLFQRYPQWEEKLLYDKVNGWIEQEYSRVLEHSGLPYTYTFYQGNPWTKEPILKKEGESLFQLIDGDWKEIAFFHFRHSKKWPL